MATKWIPGSSIQQVGQISAAMAHDEWVNIDEHGRSTGQSFSPLWQNEEERGASAVPWEECTSLNIQNILVEVQREIFNLTLKRQAFICLWEMWGVRHMTVPILQKPLTVETLTVAFAFVVWAQMILKPNSEALIEAVHPIHLCVKENVQPLLWQSDAECKEYGK